MPATTYVIQNPDNSVGICSAIDGYTPPPAAPGLAVRLLVDGEVFPPAEFRNAWTYGSTSLGVNMSTATAIHLANLATQAAPVLTAVRALWLTSTMSGDTATAAACVSRAAALSAVATTDLSAGTTPALLAAIVPEAITDPLPA
jgi:hypothetical protein